MDSVSPALAATSAAPTAPLLARALTPGESSHLDRLRAWLRGDGTDASDAAALDARWERLLETHPADVPAPAGVAAAIGIAVGDLLVASVTDATWMMCPGPDGATPGVLQPAAPHTPVLPVLDAHARWRVRAPRWTVDYVERASAHLSGCRPQTLAAEPEPQPVPPAETHAADDATAVPPVAPSDDAPVGDLPADPLTSAWHPSLVDDGTLEAPDTDADTWAPTFVDHGPLRRRSTGAAPAPVAAPAVEPAPAPVPTPVLWAPAYIAPAAAPLTVHRDHPAAPAPVTSTAGRAPEPDAADLVTPTDADSTQTPGRGLPVSAHSPLTPEDLPHRPSERVQDLALRALEVALDRAVRTAEGCAPFVLVREDQDIQVLDFEHSATGLAEARQAARDGGFSSAAIAWTSPADETRPYPRVVVDASAPGRPGIRVAHSFARDPDGGREIGGPQVVGQSAPVL